MDTANTEVYTYRQTLSLHDALPILVRTEEGQKPSVFQGLYRQIGMFGEGASGAGEGNRTLVVSLGSCCSTIELHPRTCSWPVPAPSGARSEEHTSELQSLMRISYAVFCLNTKKDLYITTTSR